MGGGVHGYPVVRDICRMLCTYQERLLFCRMAMPLIPGAVFTPESVSPSSPLVRNLDEEVM